MRFRVLVMGLAFVFGFAAAGVAAQSPASPPSGSSSETASGSKAPAKYLGCYLDKQDRDLQGAMGTAPNNAACQAFCADRGFHFAATQWGSQCFCGDSYGKYGRLPESSCNMGCSGNASEKCGGWWASSVYEVGRRGATAANSGPSPQPPNNSQVYHYHFETTIDGHSIPLITFFCIGLGFFASGFWNYRKLRLIEDTPRIHVRGVPMGWVHVHGKATGSSLLTSPVTHTPCYYYRTVVQCWVDSGKQKGWHDTHTAKDQRVFYVDDGTGKVLINPQSAEFDLPCTYWAVIGPKAYSLPKADTGPYLAPYTGLAAGPSEEELHAYVLEVTRVKFWANPETAARLEAKFAQKRMKVEANNSYRIFEYCLVAEHEYDVIGTCTLNSQAQDEQDRNMILKGQTERTFVISGFSELKLEKILRKRVIGRIFGGCLLMIGMMAMELAPLFKS